jgi:hypothetical protein
MLGTKTSPDLNARFGSLADILVVNCDVRFTPESRHFFSPIECPSVLEIGVSGDILDLHKD